MIYVKDEATGVTVEDMADGLGGVALDKAGWTHPSYATAAQADALLRGLLRLKLETLWRH